MEYGFFNVLELLGSLGIFIYGMKIMSEAIQKIAGKSLRMLLKTLTDNRFAGWLTGFITTALVQSSSATTVMVVSFVNAGLLTVAQSIGVIMGANFGTTVTSWLIAMFGFSKFKITAYALPIIAVGFPMLFTSKKKRKSLGEFLLGFGLLFIGLEFMKNSVPDLKHNPEVLQFLSDFADGGIFSVILFVFIGSVLTVIVQSSSAAMSITLVMVAQGWVPFEVGASMVLGENIGTTVTAYLASLIGNVNSKRAARAHMIFNVVGVIWMILLLGPYLKAVDYMNSAWFGYGSVFVADEAIRGAAMPKALSLFHSSFNFLNACLLIGFVPLIEKIVTKMIPESEGQAGLKLLGRNQLVETPELAILEAKTELVGMGEITRNMLATLKEMIESDSKKVEKQMKVLHDGEDATDKIEIEISGFLMDVAQQNSGSETSIKIIKMMEVSDELESIGDICYHTGVLLERRIEKEVRFGGKMRRGISDMFLLLEDASRVMIENLDAEFDEIDFNSALDIESKINALRDELKNQNLKRMEKKEDKLQSAIVFRDVYNSLEKVGDKIFQVTKVLAGK